MFFFCGEMLPIIMHNLIVVYVSIINHHINYKHSIHSNNNNKPYNNKKKQAISKSGICKFVCVCVVVQERHIERKLVTIVKRYVKCLMVDTTGVCVCVYVYMQNVFKHT